MSLLDNKNLYPTPDFLIRKMINKVKYIQGFKYILEPSTGLCNIVDFYSNYYKDNYLRYGSEKKVSDIISIDCIELDPTLQDTIRGKGYNLVWDDFLTFQPTRFYELILMNPPFDNGCNHLLKAISIQERIGGQIVCLLNAETLKNPYAHNRKILLQKLEEYNADIEYIKNAFSNSERETDVETALIYINVPMSNTTINFEGDYQRVNPEINIDYNSDKSVSSGLSKVEQLVFEYDMIKNSTIRLYTEQLKVQKMIQDFGIKDNISIAYGEYSPKVMSVNEFIDEIRLRYWHKFIIETDFKSKLPSKLRDEFTYNMDYQRDIEFSIENVRQFSIELMQGIPLAFNETVADIFDKLTVKHHYSESQWSKTRWLYNGWKSNNAFKVNNKVIVPISYWDFGIPKVLLDLNLVFNQISGVKDDIIDDEYLKEGIKNFDKKIETEHFFISAFMKQTLHVEFKNQKHLDSFNIIASKYKLWLPSSFGEKSFDKMDKEEQDSIKNFGITIEEYENYHLGNNFSLKLIGG